MLLPQKRAWSVCPVYLLSHHKPSHRHTQPISRFPLQNSTSENLFLPKNLKIQIKIKLSYPQDMTKLHVKKQTDEQWGKGSSILQNICYNNISLISWITKLLAYDRGVPVPWRSRGKYGLEHTLADSSPGRHLDTRDKMLLENTPKAEAALLALQILLVL